MPIIIGRARPGPRAAPDHRLPPTNAAAAHSEMLLQSARAAAGGYFTNPHGNSNGSAEKAIVRDMAALSRADKLHRDRLACAAYYFGTQGNFSGNPDADHARTWLATGLATLVAVEAPIEAGIQA